MKARILLNLGRGSPSHLRALELKGLSGWRIRLGAATCWRILNVEDEKRLKTGFAL